MPNKPIHVALAADIPITLGEIAPVVLPTGQTIAVRILARTGGSTRDVAGEPSVWGSLLDAEEDVILFKIHPYGWAPRAVEDLLPAVRAVRQGGLAFAVVDANRLRCLDTLDPAQVTVVRRTLQRFGFAVAEVQGVDGTFTFHLEA
ncbi:MULTISPECIES: hypothetical protein [Frankia]|uniref:Uncharacterized protein n=1 Tax=Frankia alni (strain DSM 45986 / CECT 9034 / ACN14a) TaxID=326424 RepID=Q0RM53_FRAAA|nr:MULTISPECIES: hypothetical protein [Frankia]CAJ61399.1 hypothetical protein; putative alpha-Amylase domain [Frankia alni ACN14a]